MLQRLINAVACRIQPKDLPTQEDARPPQEWFDAHKERAEGANPVIVKTRIKPEDRGIEPEPNPEPRPTIKELPRLMLQEHLEALQAENRELKQKYKRLRREARKLGARASQAETALFEAMLTLDWVAFKQGVDTKEVPARKLWSSPRRFVRWVIWLQKVKYALTGQLGSDAGPPPKKSRRRPVALPSSPAALPHQDATPRRAATTQPPEAAPKGHRPVTKNRRPARASLDH